MQHSVAKKNDVEHYTELSFWLPVAHPRLYISQLVCYPMRDLLLTFYCRTMQQQQQQQQYSRITAPKPPPPQRKWTTRSTRPRVPPAITRPDNAHEKPDVDTYMQWTQEFAMCAIRSYRIVFGDDGNPENTM